MLCICNCLSTFVKSCLTCSITVRFPFLLVLIITVCSKHKVYLLHLMHLVGFEVRTLNSSKFQLNCLYF